MKCNTPFRRLCLHKGQKPTASRGRLRRHKRRKFGAYFIFTRKKIFFRTYKRKNMDATPQKGNQTYLYDFLKHDILVICPQCEKKAIVKTADFTFGNPDNEQNIKLVCVFCGHSQRLSEKPISACKSGQNNAKISREYIFGAAIDPFFHLPLWLSVPFEENILWAYNQQHLSFLSQHIAAKLRERKGEKMSNKSLESRLPKWMTAKKNRESVLKKTEELQARL